MKARIRNWPLKLLSVFLAFLLWLAFNSSRELTTSVVAPVQYRNIPGALEMSGEVVDQVHLLLRGPSPLLARLTGSDLPVVLDMGEVSTASQYTFTIGRRQIALPSGVSLERAVPAQVRVRLEPRISRAVPVHARLENVPEGMRVGTVSVEPATLILIGPESRVRSIERVETDPVDVAALGEDGETRTTAYCGSPQVAFAGSPSVAVKVRLERAAADPKRK
jgi:YbbR domain-containing protein